MGLAEGSNPTIYAEREHNRKLFLKKSLANKSVLPGTQRETGQSTGKEKPTHFVRSESDSDSEQDSDFPSHAESSYDLSDHSSSGGSETYGLGTENRVPSKGWNYGYRDPREPTLWVGDLGKPGNRKPDWEPQKWQPKWFRDILKSPKRRHFREVEASKALHCLAYYDIPISPILFPKGRVPRGIRWMLHCWRTASWMVFSFNLAVKDSLIESSGKKARKREAHRRKAFVIQPQALISDPMQRRSLASCTGLLPSVEPHVSDTSILRSRFSRYAVAPRQGEDVAHNTERHNASPSGMATGVT